MKYIKINQKGMTIIEILLVVIIISIIAGIIIPRFLIGTQKAKVQACAMNRAIINTQTETYYFDKGSWPSLDLTQFSSAGNDYFPDGLPTCPVNYNSYTLRTDNYRVSGHAECADDHTFTNCGQ